jgi:hypothetical protein
VDAWAADPERLQIDIAYATLDVDFGTASAICDSGRTCATSVVLAMKHVNRRNLACFHYEGPKLKLALVLDPTDPANGMADRSRAYANEEFPAILNTEMTIIVRLRDSQNASIMDHDLIFEEIPLGELTMRFTSYDGTQNHAP